MTETFSAATWEFLDRVAHDNTKATFEALRSTYLDEVARGSDLSEPDRAKPPRPYPAAHPNAELLRRDGFHLTSRHRHPASITTNRFPAWCATRLAPYRALLDWLADS
jgi:hypothetical protein